MGGAALVTGAGRRIGRTLALAVARAGFDVAVHYHHSVEDAERTAQDIRALGRKAACVAADLASPQDVAALIPAARAALGPIDLLINNASLFEDDRVGALALDLFEAHMAANLRAPIFLAQAFAAQEPPAGGLIVNIIDQRVLHPNPQFFSYGLSKAALWTATRTLAQALAPAIRVNAVAPGPTLPSIHQSADDFAAEAAGVPLQRRASPDEIAAAVLYLIDAPSVTGQMIAVDGGQHLGWRTPDIVDP
jgi:NAD(P)-dependent dehydrogenase (short-subunit alcohol dehydrogenase family)